LPAKIAPFEVLHATADKFYLYFMVRFFWFCWLLKEMFIFVAQSTTEVSDFAIENNNPSIKSNKLNGSR